MVRVRGRVSLGLGSGLGLGLGLGVGVGSEIRVGVSSGRSPATADATSSTASAPCEMACAIWIGSIIRSLATMGSARASAEPPACRRGGGQWATLRTLRTPHEAARRRPMGRPTALTHTCIHLCACACACACVARLEELRR